MFKFLPFKWLPITSPYKYIFGQCLFSWLFEFWEFGSFEISSSNIDFAYSPECHSAIEKEKETILLD
jgi:hypothetical protein